MIEEIQKEKKMLEILKNCLIEYNIVGLAIGVVVQDEFLHNTFKTTLDILETKGLTEKQKNEAFAILLGKNSKNEELETIKKKVSIAKNIIKNFPYDTKKKIVEDFLTSKINLIEQQEDNEKIHLKVKELLKKNKKKKKVKR